MSKAPDIDRLADALNAWQSDGAGGPSRLEYWLTIVPDRGASDLLLVSGASPSIRVDGKVMSLSEGPLEGLLRQPTTVTRRAAASSATTCGTTGCSTARRTTSASRARCVGRSPQPPPSRLRGSPVEVRRVRRCSRTSSKSAKPNDRKSLLIVALETPASWASSAAR